MPFSWNQLKQSGFDRKPYRECDRFGTWEAAIDALACSHGSRVTVKGKGRRAGIHLFVRGVDGEKFRLYAIYRAIRLPATGRRTAGWRSYPLGDGPHERRSCVGEVAGKARMKPP